MKVSIVLALDDFKGAYEYIKECKSVLTEYLKNSNDYEIIITTTRLVGRKFYKFKNVKIYTLAPNSDYQKLVACGLDKAIYDCVIISHIRYSPNLFIDMLDEYKNGAEIVCYKEKMNFFKKTFSAIGLGFYNLTLKIFGKGLFSIGTIKDLQLLSGEILKIMKDNQNLAHRLRTMYAPYEYKTKILELNKQQINRKIKNNMLKPKYPVLFYISSVFVGLFIGFLIGGIITLIMYHAHFISYLVLILLCLLLILINSLTSVNCVAKSLIGTLYDEIFENKIYTVIESVDYSEKSTKLELKNKLCRVYRFMK